MRDRTLDPPWEHPRAWLLLFAALAASAGHGLFLYVALSPGRWLEDLELVVQRAGTPEAATLVWFLASIPLAPLALVLRGPLQRRAWITPGAVLVALATLAAFALQAQAILQGRSM
jgi:hypothetical protein